jgi:N-acetylmuramoyl-L-alanine amidase
MKSCFKLISIVMVLFIFVGCASQSQKPKSNESSINELGIELSTSKSIDGTKSVANTSEKAMSTSKETKEDKKKDSKKDKKALEGITICIDAGHGKTTKSKNKKEPIAPGSKVMKAATASGTSGVIQRFQRKA